MTTGHTAAVTVYLIDALLNDRRMVWPDGSPMHIGAGGGPDGLPFLWVRAPGGALTPVLMRRRLDLSDYAYSPTRAFDQGWRQVVDFVDQAHAWFWPVLASSGQSRNASAYRPSVPST